MYEHLLISHPAEKILQITLNRPRQLNALGRVTIQELYHAFSEFENSEKRILLLTGAGRAFCFGADFEEFQNREYLSVLLQAFQDLIYRIYNSDKITIACINGFATGAGLDLALTCDFRLAADRAKLGEAYISMGLVCDGGGSYLLTRLIGSGRALEMLATGDAVSAADARSMGIVHQVWPAEELQVKALEFAGSLAAKPQTALRLLKKLIKENVDRDLKDALENERQAQMICFEDQTHQQLVREFLNKRSKRHE